MIDIYRKAGPSTRLEEEEDGEGGDGKDRVSVGERFSRSLFRQSRRRLCYAIPDPDTLAYQNRHKLGITGLQRTDLEDRVGGGEGSPLLFSSCRTGRINVWELNLRTRKVDRSARRSRPRQTTTDTNFQDSEPQRREHHAPKRPSYGSDEQFAFDSDDLVPIPQRGSNQLSLELDPGLHKARPTPKYRTGIQLHEDWITAIAYLPKQRAVVSTSNDHYVKSWLPDRVEHSVSVLGQHDDYVRCLAHAKDADWVVSGGADQSLRIWDIGETRTNALWEVRKEGEKASTFSLATDDRGSLIAHGSPMAAIQLYDPRLPTPVGSLSGHTGNIRSMVLSADGSHLLSGSADTTIKLWSLTAQRCIETYSSHEDSVWQLYSDHPSLSVFYAGDAAGYVTKTDVSQCRESGPDENAECVVICRERSGITALTALDDVYVWTGTDSGDIRRWKDTLKREDRQETVLRLPRAQGITSPHVGSPMDRQFVPAVLDFSDDEDEDDTLGGLPLASLINIEEDDDHTDLYSPFPLSASTINGGHISQRGSVACALGINNEDMTSGQSYEHMPTSDGEMRVRPSNETTSTATPLRSDSDFLVPHRPALVKCKILTDRRRVVTVDTEGTFAVWDILTLTKICQWTAAEAKKYPFDANRAFPKRYSSAGPTTNDKVLDRDVLQNGTSDYELLDRIVMQVDDREPVADWCSVDVLLGRLNVRLEDNCFLAEFYQDDGQDGRSNESIRMAGWLFKHLFETWISRQSEAVERSNKSDIDDGILSFRKASTISVQTIDTDPGASVTPPSLSKVSSSSTTERKTPSSTIMASKGGFGSRPLSTLANEKKVLVKDAGDQGNAEGKWKKSTFRRLGTFLGGNGKDKKMASKDANGSSATNTEISRVKSNQSAPTLREMTDWEKYLAELFKTPKPARLDPGQSSFAMPDRVSITVDEMRGPFWVPRFGFFISKDPSTFPSSVDDLAKMLEEMPEWVSLFCFQSRVVSSIPASASPLRQPGRVSFRCYTEDANILPSLTLDPKVQSSDGKANAYSFNAHVKVARVVEHIADRLGCIEGVPADSLGINVQALCQAHALDFPPKSILPSTWLELVCGGEIVDLSWSALKVQRYLAKNASPIHFTYRLRPGVKLSR